ncbi:MAG: hypothetical protein QOG03_213 [Actinomycetota bacterium]|jgi:hypothetical protein|nr:hypothetical protein [Actinomycetota bacterium]
MGNLLFLGGALVISAIGSVVLWLLHRKPTSMEAGIDAFSRELQALAPQRPHQHHEAPYPDAAAQPGDSPG